ncbi:Lin0512 family protein [Amylibacter sp.]|nr:Lin0512 family protein [Amylibacter sp.]
MAKTRVAVEFGMGTSLRRKDYTKAAANALKDALWHNSLNMSEAFGFEKSTMIVDVEIAVQKPSEVNLKDLENILPYGSGSFKVVFGGLDIEKPEGGLTVIANVAVIVSYDMERSHA